MAPVPSSDDARLLGPRQLSGIIAPPSATPSLDSEPYRTVPLLNHRPTLLALMISFTVFSWICSLLRLYTRFFIVHAAGLDDLFIILTMLSTATGSIVLCILPNYGLGRSVYTMTHEEIQGFMRILYIGNATYPLSATFIKLALLFQYLRVSEARSRYGLFCKLMIGITAVWGTGFALLRWFPCFPVPAYWDFSVQNAHCWGYGSGDRLVFMRLFVSQATSTAILDLIIFAIPLRLFFRPETQRKTRLCLLGLFVLGSLAIMCAMLRMVFVIRQSTKETFRFDPSWYCATTAGLASLEVHLAAVCAALPVFWPVLTTTWGRIFVTTEVSVTREVGQLHPKPNAEVELHSVSSRRELTLDQPHEQLGVADWEPFAGDQTTGLGENETVVQAAVAEKRPGAFRKTSGLHRH